MKSYVNSLIAMVGQSAIQRVAGLFTSMVLARTLGSDGLGIYSLIVTLSNSVSNLIKLGIDSSLHVSISNPNLILKGGDKLSNRNSIIAVGFLGMLLAGSLGGFLTFMFSSHIALKIYGNLTLSVWIQCSASLVLINCVTQFFYVTLAGLNHFNQYARIVNQITLGSSVLISVAAIFWKLEGVLVGLIVTQMVTLFLLYRQFVASIALEGIKLKITNAVTIFKKLIKLGLPFYLAGLTSIPVSWYAQGLLVSNYGVDSLGILRVIGSITSIVAFLPTAIAAVVISKISHQDEDVSLAKIFADQSLKYTWAITLLISQGIFSVYPALLNTLFGIQYDEAIRLGGLGIISAVLMSIVGALSNIALSKGKSDYILLITLLQSTVMAVMSSLLIVNLGIAGYFISENISLFMAIVFGLVMFRYKGGYFELLKGTLIIIVIPTLFSFFCIYAIYFFKEDWVTQLVVGVLLLIFTIIYFYIKLLNKIEQKQFKALLFFLKNKIIR